MWYTSQHSFVYELTGKGVQLRVKGQNQHEGLPVEAKVGLEGGSVVVAALEGAVECF